MSWYKAQDFEFSAQRERALHEAEIDYERGPGTILRDFDTVLNYISERQLRVTGTHQLPLKALPEINARLARPIEHGLQRPQQKSFPPIHGLYLLVRASGLTYLDETGSKPFLLIDDEVQQAWQRLNPTEKYWNLLERWFLRASSEIIGEHATPFDPIPDNFRRSLSFFLDITADGLQIADTDAEESLTYTPRWHNLGLLMLFGCIAVEHGEPRDGEGWRIEHVFRTRFGEALFALLQQEYFADYDTIAALREYRDIPYGLLQPILAPYFPEWENNLVIPTWTFREGVHVFKISLGRLWRRIAVPADASLDALATAILDSISFDHDHLYRFSYQNRSGVQEHVNHSYLDEGPWTDETSIGELPLRIGQTLTFLYDFGDHWEFDVTLERVDAGMETDRPTVLESHGEPPEQYPVWDDEDW